MSSWRFREFEYFPKTSPIIVKDGIKAKSKQGKFGESWWAKRWISVLESFDIGARLGRGRSYARKGQVTSIDIQAGQIEAAVQGSRPRPYSVTIQVKVISNGDWKKVARVFSTQAIYAAKLLSGEMPNDIEDAFRQIGLSLFPGSNRDLVTDCSCPDWSNPCKHIAAVYYLLGEEFDRDPFLMFKLRGVSREELLEMMGKTTGKFVNTGINPLKDQAISIPVEPLSSDAGDFWGGIDLLEKSFGETIIPSVTAALPKRLGALPFWRGEKAFIESIEPFYRVASKRGLEVVLGESVKFEE